MTDSIISGSRELGIQNCEMYWERVTRDMTVGSGVVVRTNGSFYVSRSVFKTGTVAAGGTNMTVTILNSLFDHANLQLSPQDQEPSRSTFRVAFNTGYAPSGNNLIDCSNFFGGNTVTLIENNVFAGADTSVKSGTGCTATHNVLFPQDTNLGPTNKIMDPMFVDAANGNYKVQAGSPAVDSAIPSAGLDPNVDFDGTIRPQGAGPDIGAYEQ